MRIHPCQSHRYPLQIVLTLIVSGSFVLLPVQAIARPIVQTVSQAQAQGLSGNGATIVVWNGSGTNLDFTRTGETIQRAWLDDPSKITIDFDGQLCSNEQNRACRQSAASIIHLRRIVGVQFPHLPSTAKTLLTVITQAGQARKVYLFNVELGRGSPQYASLAILPSQAENLSMGITLVNGKTANWNDVDRGLARAIQDGWIQANGPVAQRVQRFLALARNGTSIEQAARQTPVPLELITKLAQLGYSMF